MTETTVAAATAEPGALPQALATSAISATGAYRQGALRAERRAWVILWSAFATFLLLTGSVVKFTSDYVATAHVDLPAQVDSSQGLVVTENAGSGTVLRGGDLPVGTVVAPTRAASVNIRLFNQSVITAMSESRVELVRMDIGRFRSTRTVETRQTAGSARYQTTDNTVVDVPGGTVNLTAGDFTVWVDGDSTSVLVYTGQAHLEAGGTSAAADVNQRAVVTADGRVSGPFPRQVDLLANGDFSQGFTDWQPVDIRDGPPDVDGQRFLVPGPEVQGTVLPAVHIVRQSVNLAHGETGLVQTLQRNVSGFRHLYVDAWVRVDSASLSGGGQLGSEYPAMLRVEYEGLLAGSQPDWLRGFYVANPENRPTQNSEQVPPGYWQHYQVDLMAVDESRIPYLVKDIEVMGQGHSYDSTFAAVHLYGD